MSGSDADYQIELRDIQGKLIQRKTVSAESKAISFDLSDFNSGAYIINIFNDTEEGTFKVIKK